MSAVCRGPEHGPSPREATWTEKKSRTWRIRTGPQQGKWRRAWPVQLSTTRRRHSPPVPFPARSHAGTTPSSLLPLPIHLASPLIIYPTRYLSEYSLPYTPPAPGALPNITGASVRLWRCSFKNVLRLYNGLECSRQYVLRPPASLLVL